MDRCGGSAGTAGAKVLICARDKVELESTFARRDGRITAIAVDITTDEVPSRIATAALESFGGVDILFNRAGVTLALLRRLQCSQPPSLMNDVR